MTTKMLLKVLSFYQSTQNNKKQMTDKCFSISQQKAKEGTHPKCTKKMSASIVYTFIIIIVTDEAKKYVIVMMFEGSLDCRQYSIDVYEA